MHHDQVVTGILNTDLNRRALMLGAALAPLAGLSITGAATAAEPHVDHDHHHHAVDGTRAKLAAQAMDCALRGQTCMQHCIELFKQGDTSTAACADTVQQMMTTCHALAQLASSDSRHLAAMTEVCIGVCADCEKECRKHEAKHVTCKECADSCLECIKICKTSLGRAV